MVGPNCMGICNFPAKLTAVFNDLKSAPGTVSFISQSGTYGVTTLNYGLKMGIDFNTFVSSGNEAVTQFSDYLEHLGNDPDTHVIMGYIESLRDGAEVRPDCEGSDEEEARRCHEVRPHAQGLHRRRFPHRCAHRHPRRVQFRLPAVRRDRGDKDP